MACASGCSARMWISRSLSLTAVPLYLYLFAIDCFQIALFFVMFFACGFSIRLGYPSTILAFGFPGSVGLNVAMGGLDALMAQPQGDHCDVHSSTGTCYCSAHLVSELAFSFDAVPSKPISQQ
jgi:hypothetical protein